MNNIWILILVAVIFALCLLITLVMVKADGRAAQARLDAMTQLANEWEAYANLYVDEVNRLHKVVNTKSNRLHLVLSDFNAMHEEFHSVIAQRDGNYAALVRANEEVRTLKATPFGYDPDRYHVLEQMHDRLERDYNNLKADHDLSEAALKQVIAQRNTLLIENELGHTTRAAQKLFDIAEVEGWARA